MKRALSLVLVLLILLSCVSCAKEADKNKETTDTTSNVQNYNELVHKSDVRFSSSDILSFNSKDGTISVQPDSMVVYAEDKVTVAVPFKDPQQISYTEVQMPFGVNIGDSAKSYAEKFSLDTGYAAFLENGSEIAMYDGKDFPDFKDGGYLYFGYALDGTGKWAYMDYYMLLYLMKGQIDVRGYGDDYNVAIYCCTVDSSSNISLVTQLYGNLANVMAITSGQ